MLPLPESPVPSSSTPHFAAPRHHRQSASVSSGPHSASPLAQAPWSRLRTRRKDSRASGAPTDCITAAAAHTRAKELLAAPRGTPPLPPCLPAFDSIVCAAALKTDGRHVISTPSHTRYNSRAETDSSVCPALPQTTLLFSELISDDDPYDDDTSILMY
ncbi:hypothetical protein ACCO45_009503 [Purpureocillium lilacinum]|uniref:Uncharacterized protein n=1 Tax=Purpureocillium lilacinum TaxID=33203 RepID=A0ACC4DLG3_PURLI